MPDKTREEFIEAFANKTSRQRKVGGETLATIHEGSSSSFDGVGIQEQLPPGYEVAWGWSSEPHRMLFVNLEGHSIISYTEGDISVTTHSNREGFTAELLEARSYYGEPRRLDRDYDESQPGNHRDPEAELMHHGEPEINEDSP